MLLRQHNKAGLGGNSGCAAADNTKSTHKIYAVCILNKQILLSMYDTCVLIIREIIRCESKMSLKKAEKQVLPSGGVIA